MSCTADPFGRLRVNHPLPRWVYGDRHSPYEGKQLTVLALTYVDALKAVKESGYHDPDLYLLRPKDVVVGHANGETRILEVTMMFRAKIMVRWGLAGTYQINLWGPKAGYLLRAPSWRLLYFEAMRSFETKTRGRDVKF